MNKMQKKWLSWQERFIALSKREKLIIYLAAVFVICFGMFKLTLEARFNQLERLEKDKKKAGVELVSTNQQSTDIENALKVDPNEKIKQEISVLQQRISELEHDLEQVMTEYIAPEQMTKALTNLLTSTENIRVVGLSALTPEKIQTNAEVQLADYYRHQFVLEVNGDYFSLMGFMKRITSKNVQFSVNNIQYDVLNHPSALMTLTLVTISDSENVIRL